MTLLYRNYSEDIILKGSPTGHRSVNYCWRNTVSHWGKCFFFFHPDDCYTKNLSSESSISRRKRKLGLKASHLTTLELDVSVKRQLILDQMAKDPKGRLGARMVKQGILRDTGIHLTRCVREEIFFLKKKHQLVSFFLETD